MDKENQEMVSILVEIGKVGWRIMFLVFNFSLLFMAIRHRYDMSGMIYALIYIAEQIHMDPYKNK